MYNITFLLLTIFVILSSCKNRVNYNNYDYLDDYDWLDEKPMYVKNDYRWYIQIPNRTKSDYFNCGMDFGNYDFILGIRNSDTYYVDDIYDTDMNIDNLNQNILPNNTIDQNSTNKFELKIIRSTYLKNKKRSYVTCYTDFDTSNMIGSICRETNIGSECFYTRYDIITERRLERLGRKHRNGCYDPDGISNVLEERIKKCG